MLPFNFYCPELKYGGCANFHSESNALSINCRDDTLYVDGAWTIGVLSQGGTGKRFILFAPASRPALGQTRPPIQWVPRGGGSFPGGVATGTWRWPLISIQCRSEEYVELYLHSSALPLSVHGVVIRW